MIARHIPSLNVTGVDYDPSAIRMAQKTYTLPNLKFQQGDAIRWDGALNDQSYDCITSFDTLEHVLHREIMLENLVRHLKPGGCLLLSTPCGSDVNNLHPFWPHHKIEYSTASLYDFLRRYFETILAPDMPGFPNLDVFDVLKGTGVSYLLQLNPVVCKNPVIFPNPYR